ncbi:hypothetical protein BGZ60DRAFT_399567 [Tricladium varicosporioides]|nr:hypothetical protein BGZ60DRAFT_399567 [Hymenoscyphus varicosporioides]
MSNYEVSTYEQRQKWRRQHLLLDDGFVSGLPKIELHVHIEGTMSSELRWKLAQRNGITLTRGTEKIPLDSLDDVKEAYKHIRGRIGANSAEGRQCLSFFEAYYGGFDLLQNEEDFYDLAMGYFEQAARMNIRYCEPFFDPQGHTRRGIKMKAIMRGFQKAQMEAEARLNVKSQWIMCILRDMSLASANEQYAAAIPYKDMIVGIGLDSDECDRPPLLFQELFSRARVDGFRITSHCDFNQKDTHEHIRQVVENLSGPGGERIDHGLNAADRPSLMDTIKDKDIGMTICPCAYIRHTAEGEIFPRIRKLIDHGIKVTIASDDPAYMEDNWLVHNLYMIQEKGSLSKADLVQLQQNAVAICWADSSVKRLLLDEVELFGKTYVLPG